MRLHNPDLTERARELRRNMTEHERKLWYCFFKKQNFKVCRQKVIGKYIVDFYCPAAKTVIEIDGSQHFTGDGEYDLARTVYLMDYGFKVLRYTNKDIDTRFDDVCNDIYENLTHLPD